jgi:hypothetical protein
MRIYREYVRYVRIWIRDVKNCGSARTINTSMHREFFNLEDFHKALRNMDWIRDLGSGTRDPRFGIRDSGSGIRDPVSGIRDPGFGIRDSGSGIRNPRSGKRLFRIPDPDPGVKKSTGSATLCPILYYLDFEVFNFHGLAPEGLGPPVQRFHVLVIQVDGLVTVRDHQLQILEKNGE